jgi:hypothetical protein
MWIGVKISSLPMRLLGVQLAVKDASKIPHSRVMALKKKFYLLDFEVEGESRNAGTNPQPPPPSPNDGDDGDFDADGDDEYAKT